MKKKINAEAVQGSVIAASVVDKLKKKSYNLVKRLPDNGIKTKDQYNLVAKTMGELKEIRKEADAQLHTITDLAKLIVKNAEVIFRPFLRMLDQTEIALKGEAVKWINANEQKAIEVESKFKKTSTIVSKQTELRDNSHKDISVRKVWTLTIEDVKKIPREFLVPDETAIRNALKAGKKVPGCKWSQENSIAV